MFWDRFWGHLWTLSVALGRLDSGSIWHVHVCRIYGLVAYWFEHRVYFCTNTFPDSGSTRFVQPRKRQTLQPGPNYATLVCHRRHLACDAYFQPARACGCLKNLGKSQKLVRPWAEQPDQPCPYINMCATMCICVCVCKSTWTGVMYISMYRVSFVYLTHAGLTHFSWSSKSWKSSLFRFLVWQAQCSTVLSPWAFSCGSIVDDNEHLEVKKRMS